MFSLRIQFSRPSVTHNTNLFIKYLWWFWWSGWTSSWRMMIVRSNWFISKRNIACFASYSCSFYSFSSSAGSNAFFHLFKQKMLNMYTSNDVRHTSTVNNKNARSHFKVDEMISSFILSRWFVFFSLCVTQTRSAIAANDICWLLNLPTGFKIDHWFLCTVFNMLNIFFFRHSFRKLTICSLSSRSILEIEIRPARLIFNREMSLKNKLPFLF